MDDVQRYAWLGDTRFGWLRRGACVTFVHGLGEDEVIRRFGGDPSVTSQASLPEPCDVDLYATGDHMPRDGAAPAVTLVVTSMGEWVVVAEREGWQGVVPDILGVSLGPSWLA